MKYLKQIWFFLFSRFCVGDRFYLCENKILCEYDYEERLVFATMANHPMLKRHANNISQTGAQQQQQQGGHNAMNIGGGPPTSVAMGGQQRTSGDHNNNGPPTSNAVSPFSTPSHMKATLGSSS